MHIGIIVRHCVLGAAIAACGRTGGAAMDDSTFVAAMARLHALDRNYALTDAARDSLRRGVLQAEGLTTAELERQARHYADDPARAAAIWSAINARMAALLVDTTARPSGAKRDQEQTR